MADETRRYAQHASYQQQHLGQTSVIRPPQGFAWESSGSFGPTVQPYYDGSYISTGPAEPSHTGQKRRSKEKSKSKDKHKSKYRPREDYDPPAIDHHVSQDIAGHSNSNTIDDRTRPRRPDRTAYPSTDHHPLPPPRNHDSPSYIDDALHHSSSPFPEEHYHLREPPPGYTPSQYREHIPMDSSANPSEPGVSGQAPSPPRNQLERATQQGNFSPDTSATQVSRQQPLDSASTQDVAKQQCPPRLVTLLIEDMRLKESQLAEVRVPLKERPDDQIWADAMDITHALQAGPSRIDGPAKVSTSRGEFKQIFFRVAANGAINCTSANVQVSAQRTIKVLVEDPDSGLPLQQYRTAHGMMASTMMVPPGLIPRPQPAPPVSGNRFGAEQYGPSLDERHPSSLGKRPRSISHEVTQGTQWPQGQPPYPDHPSATRDYHPSGPPPNQKVVREGTSSSTSQSPGSDPSSSSGMDESQDAQPSQISPLSQAGSLVQMSPASIPNPMTPTPPGTQDRRPNQRLASVSSSRDSPPSYAQGNSTAQQYSPDNDQQRPPPKKPRHDVHDQSPAPQGPSNDGGTMQPPMGSLAPPGATTNPPQPNGAFGSFSFNLTHGQPTPASASPSTNAPTAQRAPSAPGGRPSPTAVSGTPSAFAQTDPKVDDAVAHYLRGIFKPEAQFIAYLEARNKNLPVSKWIKHLQYVQTKFEQYVGKPVPEGVTGAGSLITKTQICRAFYQNNASWGEECSDVVALSKLYGPDGQRDADPDAVDLYNEPEGVTTTLQMRRYLALLRNIHAKWVAE